MIETPNVEKVKLGSIVEIKRGSSPRPIQKYINKGSKKWLKITDIKDNRIYSVKQTISDKGALSGVKAVKGDIIYTNSATPGIAIKLELDEIYLNDGFLLFTKLSDKINDDYLINFLNATRAQILTKGAGSIFTNLNKDIVSNISIPLNNIREQEKIAAFLNTFDSFIKDSKEKLFELRLKKQYYLSAIFNDMSGEEVKIKDIFTITRGKVIPKSNLNDAGKYPVYSSQTSNGGVMGYTDDYLFENAITWTTDGANAGTVSYREGKFNCSNVCGVLLSDKGYVNRYMAEYINSITKQYVSYVGNPKLMNNVVSEIPIKLISLKLQVRYSNLLTSIDELVKTIQFFYNFNGLIIFRKGFYEII